MKPIFHVHERAQEMARVLIVDDNADVGNFVLNVLRPLAEACYFHSPSQVLSKIKEGDVPDLLISDVDMPIYDGFTLAREARQVAPGLRIMFMSGGFNILPGDSENDRFILKPFTPKDFLQKLNDWLS
jgi:CheY-like chemotaxis protein